MNAYETKVLQKLRNDLEREGFHLAPGWRVAIETRKSGATKGGTDKYYFSPDGRKLRSKTEVMRFLSSTSSDEKSKRGRQGRATKVAKMIEKENIAEEYNKKKEKKKKKKKAATSGLNFEKSTIKGARGGLRNADETSKTRTLSRAISSTSRKRSDDFRRRG